MGESQGREDVFDFVLNDEGGLDLYTEEVKE